MKKVILISALFTFIFAGSSLLNSVSAQQKAELGIKTFFHCANGKALLEKELAKVDGVSKVVADVETKVVTIEYDPSKLNQDKLVAEIERIGYKTEFTKEDTKINKACSHGNEGEHHEMQE
jgi:copper chaperone CopZ